MAIDSTWSLTLTPDTSSILCTRHGRDPCRRKRKEKKLIVLRHEHYVILTDGWPDIVDDKRQQQKRKDNQGPLLLVLIFSTLLYQGIVYLTTNSSIFSIEGRKMVLME